MNIDEIKDEAERLGLDWADKKAAAKLLEETKKPALAKCISDLQRRNPDMAYNRASAMAQAEPSYEAHITKMIEARKEADRAEVKYETYKSWIDLWRSREATDRAAMQMR